MGYSAASSLESRIRSVSSDVLLPIVQQITGCAGSLTSWICEPVHVSTGGLGASSIYRFSGLIQSDTEKFTWSLILKVLSQSLVKGIHWNDLVYLQREYEFYQSDLGRSFPAGFRAARCYDQSIYQGETGSPEFWLWLEDLTSLGLDSWNLEHNAQAARALGKFNGAFLVDQPLPRMPWLNSGYLRQYMGGTGIIFERLFEQRDLPLVRRLCPPAVVDSLAEMWQHREEHLATFDRLPQTLCHGDALRTNLFLRANAWGESEMVAIDWGTVGIASISLDLAQVFFGSMNPLDEAYTQALFQVLYENYLAGLSDAGWQGDPRWVRLGYTAAMFKLRVSHIFHNLPGLTPGPKQQQLIRRYAAHGLSFEAGLAKESWIHVYLGELFTESLKLRQQLLG